MDKEQICRPSKPAFPTGMHGIACDDAAARTLGRQAGSHRHGASATANGPLARTDAAILQSLASYKTLMNAAISEAPSFLPLLCQLRDDSSRAKPISVENVTRLYVGAGSQNKCGTIQKSVIQWSLMRGQNASGQKH